MPLLLVDRFIEFMLFQYKALDPNFVFSFSKPFDEVPLEVDGAVLSALHFRAEDPKGVILFLHGNAENLLICSKIAPRFVTQGYDLFAIDYRGYGKSTGRITTEEMLHDDVNVAYEYLRDSYSQDEIICYGRSLGTGLATRLASANQPNMLILEAPYFSMVDRIQQSVSWIPEEAITYPLRTDQWIKDVNCPIYLFHGDNDETIPHDSSLRLAELLDGPHELFIIQGGGHNNLSSKTIYRTELARILSE